MSLIKRFDIIDITQTEIYLRRWSLSLPFGWSIKLHHIRRADSDHCRHDRPWGFWTLILRGGYEELIGEDQKLNRMRPGRLAWRPPRFRHRITCLPNGSGRIHVAPIPVSTHVDIELVSRWVLEGCFSGASGRLGDEKVGEIHGQQQADAAGGEHATHHSCGPQVLVLLRTQSRKGKYTASLMT